MQPKVRILSSDLQWHDRATEEEEELTGGGMIEAEWVGVMGFNGLSLSVFFFHREKKLIAVFSFDHASSLIRLTRLDLKELRHG